MKKHLKVILIVILVLSICGAGAWFIFSRPKYETLPTTVNTFIEHEDSNDLHLRLNTCQSLYSKHFSGDTRLNSLKGILTKLDDFELDLNTYLLMCNTKARTTKDLTSSYNNLSTSRTKLIKDCDEFIVRMNGNTMAEGQPVKALYNELFNKVAEYLLQYNTCFLNTSNFVFTSVTSNNNIKYQLYSLYSYGVRHTLNNVGNSQFKSPDITMLSRLNTLIQLDEHNNLVLKNNLSGGEFNVLALNFKKHYNNSDKTLLISNFNSYYSASIITSTETSNEKLAVYYFKQIMEV